jgi:hypothetical protein
MDRSTACRKTAGNEGLGYRWDREYYTAIHITQGSKLNDVIWWTYEWCKLGCNLGFWDVKSKLTETETASNTLIPGGNFICIYDSSQKFLNKHSNSPDNVDLHQLVSVRSSFQWKSNLR